MPQRATRAAKSEPGKPGRPTRLTPELENAICVNLELAMPLKLAAEAEGVPERTIMDWLARGREPREDDADSPRFVAFYAAVTRAKARGAKSLTLRGLAGGKGSAAAQWFLERRYREDYGPVQKLIVEGESDLSDDERDAQIAAFKRAIVGSDLPARSDGLGDPGARSDAADAGQAPPPPTQ